MALATTCPKCNTSFRVAPDQLALRRGMVRCGICQNVFSGMSNLRHVDEILRQRSAELAASKQSAIPDAPIDSANPAAPGSVPPQAAVRAMPIGQQAGGIDQSGRRISANSSASGLPGNARGTFDATSKRRSADKPSNQRGAGRGGANTFAQTDLRTAFFLPETVFGPTTEMVAEGQEFLSEPAAVPASIKPQSDAEAAAQRPLSEISDEPATIMLRQPGPDTRIRWAKEASQAQSGVPAGVNAESVAASGAAATNPGGSPTADQAARRSKRRRSEKRDRSDEAIAYFAPEASVGGFTSRRIALGWLACFAAALLLFVQLLIGARHALSASFPSLRGPLQAVAAPFGLRVEPPLDLQSLTIESFELQATDKPGQLLMSALLRNQANRPVQWPALEIVLTDGQGVLLVRKVLLPKDYFAGLPADSVRLTERGVSPHAELPLKLALEARELAASGYSVTLFYP